MDGQGKILAHADADLKLSRPEPGWSEQNPSDWWQACLSAVDGLSKTHPEHLSRLAGIGLCGQMHGATLLDVNHEILRPAILWNDGRSGDECKQIEIDCPRSREISGNIAMAGFTAPKLAWIRNNEPDIFAAIHKVLLPKDYLRFRLCGEFITDMSDASGTLWLDVKKRDWSDTLLATCGLTRAHMPELVEGTDIAGELSEGLKTRWNLRGTIPIAGGAVDNAAAACGIGAIKPGAGFVSLGTSGVLFVSNDRFSPNTKNAVHAFCHAVPDTWHQMGVILSATDSLNWLARITQRNVVDLVADVEANFLRPAQEIFLPYLSGERTPHNNPDARGSFIGLSHNSTPTTMAQAVMESIAFAFLDSKQALNAAGSEISHLTAVGGGSNSPLWLKIIATNLNMDIQVPEEGDFGGAFGAARLALCAVTGADPAQICTSPKVRHTVQPETDLLRSYQDNYQRYKALYLAIERTSS
ncbi:MAG: xylulokinase [Devosiaceae bacterium]|nr:xylulokinase [Devosiaceae bacterium]